MNTDKKNQDGAVLRNELGGFEFYPGATILARFFGNLRITGRSQFTAGYLNQKEIEYHDYRSEFVCDTRACCERTGSGSGAHARPDRSRQQLLVPDHADEGLG